MIDWNIFRLRGTKAVLVAAAAASVMIAFCVMGQAVALSSCLVELWESVGSSAIASSETTSGAMASAGGLAAGAGAGAGGLAAGAGAETGELAAGSVASDRFANGENSIRYGFDTSKFLGTGTSGFLGFPEHVLWMLALFLACFTLQRGIETARAACLQKFADRNANLLREKLLDRMFSQGRQFTQKHGTGKLCTTLIEGIDQVELYLASMPAKFADLAFVPLVLVFCLLALDMVSGVIALLVLPCIFFYMNMLGKSAKEAAAKQLGAYTRMANHFIDTLRGLSTLKLFGKSKQYAREVYAVSESARETSMATIRVATLSSLALDLFRTFALAAIAIMLGFRLMDGSISLFAALATLIVTPEFFAAIRRFSTDFHATLDGKNQLASILEMIGAFDNVCAPAPLPAPAAAAVAPASLPAPSSAPSPFPPVSSATAPAPDAAPSPLSAVAPSLTAALKNDDTETATLEDNENVSRETSCETRADSFRIQFENARKNVSRETFAAQAAWSENSMLIAHDLSYEYPTCEQDERVEKSKGREQSARPSHGAGCVDTSFEQGESIARNAGSEQNSETNGSNAAAFSGNVSRETSCETRADSFRIQFENAHESVSRETLQGGGGKNGRANSMAAARPAPTAAPEQAAAAARPALEGISFAVHGCCKVGIVGASGAGKTTLAQVLAGFYTPSSGSLVWKKTEAACTARGESEACEKSNMHAAGAHTNNSGEPSNARDANSAHDARLAQDASEMGGIRDTQDISSAKDPRAKNNWLSQVTYLPQNPHLFHGTLAYNIAFYKPDASIEEIAHAAACAGLDELVAKLPEGMNTLIGEGARQLSGGQAQRVALARTFLDANRRVLVFDEPTAHLDIETEYELKENMLKLMEGRLVFFATHRLHWLQNMDYVLMLEKGKIIQQGTPAELLQMEGPLTALIRETNPQEGGSRVS